jgi:cyclohexyl-isocyanide hydratase
MTESSIPLQFGLLVFPNVQQLELTGPYEVFATWPGGRVRLVAKTLESVTSSTGLVLEPDASFDDCPQLDVLCVPRGCRGKRFDGR